MCPICSECKTSVSRSQTSVPSVALTAFFSLQICFEGQCRNTSFFEMEGCAKKCNGHGVHMLGVLGLLCDDVHGGRHCGRPELSRVLTPLPCPAFAPGLQQQPELPLLPGLGPTLLQHAGPRGQHRQRAHAPRE